MSAQAAARVVLVVEDETLVRECIASEFEAEGWQVLEAASAEHALIVMSNNKIDVVFTDINLAGKMCGWEMAETMRATAPGVAIIYASGKSCVPARQVADSIFIGKPYSSTLVMETCAKVLAH